MIMPSQRLIPVRLQHATHEKQSDRREKQQKKKKKENKSVRLSKFARKRTHKMVIHRWCWKGQDSTKREKFLLKCDYMNCVFVRSLGGELIFVRKKLFTLPHRCLNSEHYLESLNGWRLFSVLFTIYLDYVGSSVVHRLYLIVCFPSFKAT